MTEKQRNAKLARIEKLEGQLAQLRNELGASPRGEELFCTMIYDDELIVVADGKGRADLIMADGDFHTSGGTDFLQKHHRFFETEEEACLAAERILAAYKAIAGLQSHRYGLAFFHGPAFPVVEDLEMVLDEVFPPIAIADASTRRHRLA